MTKNYIIITETPFVVSPYDLLLTDTSFIENFNWKPKNGIHFIVIDKNTGKKVGIYKTEPFFTLHHVNAFETDGLINIDLVAYKDPGITKTFSYQNLSNPRVQIPAGHLKRYTIDQAWATVHVHNLSQHPIELPTINPSKLMHEEQYVYGTSNDHGFAQQLIKLDLHSKCHHTWHCKGCYPGEPIFVPKPGASCEDEGVILSLVLDACEEKSFLLILDAKTFKEIGRAYAPHHIPFAVHSKFFNL
jgi:carotenoid cleavage dioxygenase-like enzyme